MYRLIAMVTMPLHGCVGSGLIANEKKGFAARQITVHHHYREAIPCCAEGQSQLFLLMVSNLKSVFYLPPKMKKQAYHRYPKMVIAFQMSLSWMFIFLVGAHFQLFPPHTALLWCSFPRFLPPDPASQHQTSHKRAHMAASHQEQVSWQAAGNLRPRSFYRLKATNPQCGSQKYKFSFIILVFKSHNQMKYLNNEISERILLCHQVAWAASIYIMAIIMLLGEVNTSFKKMICKMLLMCVTHVSAGDFLIHSP